MSQPVKIAYLEISPRMTGKTARLCKFANDLSAAGQTVIYVCPRGLAPGLRVEMSAKDFRLGMLGEFLS